MRPSGLRGSALGLPHLAWITALAPNRSGSAFGPLVMSSLCRNAVVIFLASLAKGRSYLRLSLSFFVFMT